MAQGHAIRNGVAYIVLLREGNHKQLNTQYH